MRARRYIERVPDRPRTIDVGGRTPPSNLEAEEAVLSAVLVDGNALDAVTEFLAAEHFYSDAHRRIFEAAVAVHGRGDPIDLQTVAAELRDRERLANVGGIAYLTKIIDATPAVAHVVAHAKIVREKSMVRCLAETCQLTAAEAYGDYGDAREFVARASEQVATISEQTVESRMASMGEIGRTRDAEIRAQWEGKRDPWGMSGPWRELHRRTAGFFVGETTYVAADTGGGKSAFAQQATLHLAGRKYNGETIGCAYLTLEMHRDRIYDRGLVMLTHRLAPEGMAGVTLQELRTGKDEEGEPLDYSKVALIEAAQKLARELPIEIDDADKDITRVRAAARKAQARLRARGARLRNLVVDHMHIMEFPDAESEASAIAEMVRQFNRIAVELDVHLFVLAQYNRGATAKDKPAISDIRGASAIEQIAQRVLLIHRPFLRMADKSKATLEQTRASEIIIGKNRDFKLGHVPVEFVGERFHFQETE